MRAIRGLLAAIALAAMPATAFADANVNSTVLPWNQAGNTVSVSAGTSGNSAVQLGWVAAQPNNPPPTAAVYNTGSVDAYCSIGGSGVTASATLPTASVAVPAGSRTLMVIPNNTAQFIICATASGSTTLAVASGTGTPTAGGVGSGGGTGTFMLNSASNASLPAARDNIGLGQSNTPQFAGATLLVPGTTLIDSAAWSVSTNGTASALAASSGNQFLLNLQSSIPVTGASANYERALLLGEMQTSDPSSSFNLDAVDLDFRCTITATNSFGRCFGAELQSIINSGGDGLAYGAELGLVNNGTDQASFDTTTSKYTLHIGSSGSSAVTAGIYIDKYGSTLLHYPIFIKDSVVGTGANDRAIEVGTPGGMSYFDVSSTGLTNSNVGYNIQGLPMLSYSGGNLIVGSGAAGPVIVNPSVLLAEAGLAAGSTIHNYTNDLGGGFTRLTYNSASVPASDAGGGLAVSWNQTGGGAETDLWNVVTNGGGFYFNQKTGASTFSTIGRITSTGINATAIGATTASTGAFTTVSAQATISTGSAPTLTTGSCSGSSWTGGATAGKFTAATCAAGTYILSGLPTAPNGYTCVAQDQTTPADTLKQTANGTTSCTLTSTTANNDVIAVAAMAW